MKALKTWWDNIGWCWNHKERGTRTFGIRLFGKRFFWFVIDDSDTASKKENNDAAK